MLADDELTNMEIVTLAIYVLGGAVEPVDIEDAAIEAFRLAPNKFSWLKHAEQIDLRTVQYAAKNACTADVGLLQGSIKHGYMLTHKGLEWADNFNQQGRLISGHAKKLSSSDLVAREQLRLQGSRAFQKFTTGERDSITIMDYREFARVNDYFPVHLRQQRFEKIENIVKGEPDLRAAWEYLKSRFRGE